MKTPEQEAKKMSFRQKFALLAVLIAVFSAVVLIPMGSRGFATANRNYE